MVTDWNSDLDKNLQSVQNLMSPFQICHRVSINFLRYAFLHLEMMTNLTQDLHIFIYFIFNLLLVEKFHFDLQLD